MPRTREEPSHATPHARQVAFLLSMQPMHTADRYCVRPSTLVCNTRHAPPVRTPSSLPRRQASRPRNLSIYSASRQTGRKGADGAQSEGKQPRKRNEFLLGGEPRARDKGRGGSAQPSVERRLHRGCRGGRGGDRGAASREPDAGGRAGPPRALRSRRGAPRGGPADRTGRGPRGPQRPVGWVTVVGPAGQGRPAPCRAASRRFTPRRAPRQRYCAGPSPDIGRLSQALQRLPPEDDQARAGQIPCPSGRSSCTLTARLAAECLRGVRKKVPSTSG